MRVDASVAVSPRVKRWVSDTPLGSVGTAKVRLRVKPEQFDKSAVRRVPNIVKGVTDFPPKY
jgi:hypothetical protein